MEGVGSESGSASWFECPLSVVSVVSVAGAVDTAALGSGMRR